MLATFAATLFSMLLLTTFASAGPLESCRCMIGGRTDTGSVVENATYCTQNARDDQSGRRWCDITAECLRGRIGPNCDKQKKLSDATSGREFVGDAQRIIGSIVQQSTAFVDSADVLGALEKIWLGYRNDPLAMSQIDNCLTAFRAGRPFGFNDNLRLTPIQVGGVPFGAVLACASNPGKPTLHFILELRDVRLRWPSGDVQSRGRASLGFHVVRD